MVKNIILKRMNILILLYVCILSFVLLLFNISIAWYYLLWVIIDQDILVFIHIPLLSLILQVLLKKRYFNNVSISYLIINSIAISLLSYFLFYSIAIIFILLGIKGG